MTAVEALTRLGGVAGARELMRLTSSRKLRRAIEDGSVLQVARGRYALPTADDARRAASSLTGVVCLRSAAAHYGWEMKKQPDQPEVAVTRGRKVAVERREDVQVVWMNVSGDDLTGVSVRGAGAGGVRRVLRHADGRAANPFESVLRAQAIEAGLDVEPQATLDLGSGVVHPDLTDRSRRLVLEADSWTHHATRSAHKRDCARYNLLVLRGWLVLRFTWEQVMLAPTYVRWVLEQVRRVERPELLSALARPA